MLERLIRVYDLGGKEYTLILRRKLCCTLTHFNKVSMKLQPARLLLYRKNRKFVLSKANSIFHKNKINAEAEKKLQFSQQSCHAGPKNHSSVFSLAEFGFNTTIVS